jgi:hypothetical protein
LDYYTYLYRDPSRNNEPIYVGYGRLGRAREHLRRIDNNPFPNRLKKMKRTGVNPSIEFLAKDLSKVDAKMCEVAGIWMWGRKDLKHGTLLNMTDGGEGSDNVGPLTRQRLRVAALNRSPEVQARINVGLRAVKWTAARKAQHSERSKHRSPTHLANLSKSACGPRSDEQCDAISRAMQKTNIPDEERKRIRVERSVYRKKLLAMKRRKESK